MWIKWHISSKANSMLSIYQNTENTHYFEKKSKKAEKQQFKLSVNTTIIGSFLMGLSSDYFIVYMVITIIRSY